MPILLPRTPEEFHVAMATPGIPTIETDGGPCGAKTTGLCAVEEHLHKIGYTCFKCSEAATFNFGAGMRFNTSGLSFEEIQDYIMDTQIAHEALIRSAARKSTKKKKIILFDRGLTTQKGYMEAEAFSRLCEARGLSERRDMRDRYDAVLHMVTAAQDAEEFYSNENNPERYETAEEARERDRCILAAWLGHPHLRVFGNKDINLKTKINNMVREVCHILGDPEPLEIEKKYLVRKVPLPDVIPSNTDIIEQVYLYSADSNTSRRVRKRGFGTDWTCRETIKTRYPDGRCVEREWDISEHEYHQRTRVRDPSCALIRKLRTCFVYEHQYFELDTPIEPTPKKALGDDIQIMELELTSQQQTVVLPPWIDVIADVTDDPEYKWDRIAKRCGG